MPAHLYLRAKLGQSTWPDSYHPLIFHLIDVACVTQAIRTRVLRAPLRRMMAEHLGLSEEAAGPWIAFWAGAHDIGKATAGFQFRDEKQRELRRRLEAEGFEFPPADPKHHSDTGTKIISDELASGGVSWPKLSRDLAKKVAVTVGGVSGTLAESRFATHKKHITLAPYSVYIIDQSLLQVMQTKHRFVRLSGRAGNHTGNIRTANAAKEGPCPHLST